MAWMMRAASMVVKDILMPIVAPHAAQPIKAKMRMMRICFEDNPNIFLPP